MEPDIANLRYYILAYLLSTTFKDCSILFRLNNPHGAENERDNTVTIIDLDPKRVDKLWEWEKLDEELARSYVGVEGKECLDEWVG